MQAYVIDSNGNEEWLKFGGKDIRKKSIKYV